MILVYVWINAYFKILNSIGKIGSITIVLLCVHSIILLIIGHFHAKQLALLVSLLITQQEDVLLLALSSLLHLAILVIKLVFIIAQLVYSQIKSLELVFQSAQQLHLCIIILLLQINALNNAYTRTLQRYRAYTASENVKMDIMET